MAILDGKTIVIGVTGGIAAYKAVDVVSRLKKLGADVKVVMTRAACEFVTPLTFQSMSQNLVAVDMFAEPKRWEIEHISLANAADVMAVVPATANIIGKIANGLADELLTTTVMATKAPVLIVPAMNSNMYTNKIVMDNMRKLKEYGYHVIEPAEGRLACGVTGKGRLADVNDIVEKIVGLAVYKNKDLAGKNVLITAGATEEDIDAVRFITNRSSGKMGYELARAAYRRGAEVTLVAARNEMWDITGVNIIHVRTAQEMYDAVMDNASNADIIIKAAAVGDFRVRDVADNKIKKSENLTLEFILNPDILKELGRIYVGGNKTIVGFCMETENLIENAKKKLIEKNVDIIVANNLNDEGAGFGGDTNVVTILDKNGNAETLGIMGKDELAHKIFDYIIALTDNK